MPLYEYQCKKCHSLTERIQKFSDPPLAVCPHCGGELEQLISAPALRFKGTGWYETDYAKKSSPGSASNGNGSELFVCRRQAGDFQERGLIAFGKGKPGKEQFRFRQIRRQKVMSSELRSTSQMHVISVGHPCANGKTGSAKD